MISNSEPKVSIILPTRNRASTYLRESIQSCLNQVHRNLELIIVDDGSSDNTPGVVKLFCDPRIRYIRHSKQMGLPASLNTGFRISSGDFLTWTSDDNAYLPDAICRLVDALRNSREAAFVYADYYAFYEDSGQTDLRRTDHEELARKNSVGPCFLYARHVYETVGDYDPRYSLVEDYEYWIRVGIHFKMLHYPEPLYTYREHSRSLTSSRTLSVFLFTSILKFEKRYISTRQLWSALYHFCSATVRSEGNVSCSVTALRQTLSKVSAISLTLGLWFVAFSLSAIVLSVLHAFYRFGVRHRLSHPS